MSIRTKRQAIETIRTLMRRPRWWNEAFAKYDQKKLKAWAEQQAEQRKLADLRPLQPRLTSVDVPLHDRLIVRELYKPYVARGKFFVGVA